MALIVPANFLKACENPEMKTVSTFYHCQLNKNNKEEIRNNYIQTVFDCGSSQGHSHPGLWAEQAVAAAEGCPAA